MSGHTLLSQAARSPASPTPALPQRLQRACACGGSAGTSGKCSSCETRDKLGVPPLQAKLTVSAPDDPYEKEADSVADRVMRMPGPAAAPPGISPLIQRETKTPDEDEEQLTAQREPMGPEEEEEELTAQREAAAPAAPAVSGGFAATLGAQPGGSPLPAAARAFFEPRFGRGLGHVRVHDGAPAASLAHDVNARAFTLGSDIFFAPGQYDAQSSTGRRLLAHELTHTFQQGSERKLHRKALAAAPAVGPVVRVPMDSPHNPNEVAAEQTAASDSVGSEGASPPPAGAAPSDGAAELPAALAGMILRPSGGAALAPELRADGEARLGSRLDHVRVHQGPAAARLADALDARAFTYGADIWLGEGESSGDRHLMTHELTHVAQQAPRTPADEVESEPPAPNRLQASKRWYYALPALGKGSKGPGDRAHDLLFPLIGSEPKNSGLFAEVPIPEGASTGATGRADLVKTDNDAMFGVKFENNQPAFQSMHARTLLNGAKLTDTAHIKSAAPAGNTLIAGGKACKASGLPSGQGICRIDSGPGTVKIADLKPNYEAEVLLGGPQVDRYVTKVGELGTKVNSFASANPALIHPAGKSWSVTARRMTSKEIEIPGNLENPTAKSHRTVEANLYVNDTQTRITDKCAVHVAKHSDGFITYEFIPEHQLGAATPGAAGVAPRPGGTIGDAKTKLGAVKEKLKEEPESKRVAKLPRGAARPRLALKREKLEAKDNFQFKSWKTESFGPWQTTAKAATGGEGRSADQSPSTEAEQRMRDEAARQINSRVKVATKAPPADTAARTREMELVQHWIDHGEKYGRLRDFFGTAYVKVVKAYDSIKSKIETKVEDAKKRMGRAGKGATGIKGAVLGVLRGIAGSLLGVFIRDVAHRLVTAVQKGATVLLGTLFGEEVEKVEEQLKAIEEAEAEFKAFIASTIEEKFGEQLKLLDEKIKQIESVAATVSDIGTLVNIVKWAYRIAQCGAPPLLGCIIALVGSAIAEAIIAAIVASCWFQREVAYPIVSALGPVRALPGIAAEEIAKRVRDLLPTSLMPLMGEVDTSDLDSKPSDVECDSANKYNKMDPTQLKLAEMLKQYDPDHVESLLKALEHLGVAKNPPDPDATISDAEIAALKKLLDKYSKDQLDEIVTKTPAEAPRTGVKTGDFISDLDNETNVQGGGTATQPLPPQGGPAPTPGTPPTAEEIAEEAREVVEKLKTASKPPPGERRFGLKVDKSKNLLKADGTPAAAGDQIRVLLVVTMSNGVSIGGMQTLTIVSVTDTKVTATVHAGTRYYNLEGTFVETSIDESSVAWDRLPMGNKK